MKRIIRHKAPFILFGITILLTAAKYYSFYFEWFRYLPDLVGYSIVTNVFMLSVYLNSRYCDATKVTVLGLLALNLYSLVSHGFNAYHPVYDFYIIGIILAILVAYKIQPKRELK